MSSDESEISFNDSDSGSDLFGGSAFDKDWDDLEEEEKGRDCVCPRIRHNNLLPVMQGQHYYWVMTARAGLPYRKTGQTGTNSAKNPGRQRRYSEWTRTAGRRGRTCSRCHGLT